MTWDWLLFTSPHPKKHSTSQFPLRVKIHLCQNLTHELGYWSLVYYLYATREVITSMKIDFCKHLSNIINGLSSLLTRVSSSTPISQIEAGLKANGTEHVETVFWCTNTQEDEASLDYVMWTWIADQYYQESQWILCKDFTIYWSSSTYGSKEML